VPRDAQRRGSAGDRVEVAPDLPSRVRDQAVERAVVEDL
jgi:hypothetical protein